jgi:hypothetical protein
MPRTGTRTCRSEGEVASNRNCRFWTILPEARARMCGGVNRRPWSLLQVLSQFLRLSEAATRGV